MEETEVLKRVHFFKDLTSWEILQINKISERKIYKAGEIIVKEGTVCDAFHIIKNGFVKIEKNGREIATLGNEEPIGEISFMDKGLRSATVTALQDTAVITLPSDAFESLMTKEKDIAIKVYKAIASTLCQRLRETNEILVQIH
jgi:CRP/FNR family cyclic AMP-dependent transcriptional regulator